MSCTESVFEPLKSAAQGRAGWNHRAMPTDATSSTDWKFPVTWSDAEGPEPTEVSEKKMGEKVWLPTRCA